MTKKNNIAARISASRAPAASIDGSPKTRSDSRQIRKKGTKSADSGGTIPPPTSSIFAAEAPESDEPPHSYLLNRSLDASLASPLKPATHEYEPLEGGTGREVYYRQARFAISDLLGEHGDIEHTVHFGSHRGTIIDFGINGVAFSTNSTTCNREDVIDRLRVQIGDCTLYEGRASVRYCRQEANESTTVGSVLLDGILDTDAVITAKNRALADKTAQLVTLALCADVSAEYRQAMADLVLMFSSYRKFLSGQELSLASLSTASAKGSAEREVLNVSIEKLRSQYEPYRKQCNSLTCTLSGPTKRAYRQYTEAVLHPYLLGAPLAHHSYNKPLGYPGDFVLMSYLYDQRPYGKTLYDKLIHEVVCRHEPMGNGVVKRKDFLVDQIRAVVQKTEYSSQRPCRIMSLASGPAQEVVEFANECQDASKSIVFTLIDQDQRSLTHVNSSLSRALIPGSTNIRANYLYLGFKNMITVSEVFDELPAQHLIYAAGLFDYVRTATAQRLVRRLFRKLAPGGRLLVGNFKSPNDSLWAMDYWMDWHLIYRTYDEMRVLADKIEEPHDLEITTDASGYTYVLVVTRT